MAFLATEWLAAVGYETDRRSSACAACSSANPGPSVRGAPQLVKLTNEDMLGGLYYWAAASPHGAPDGILRHDMSMPGQPASST